PAAMGRRPPVLGPGVAGRVRRGRENQVGLVVLQTGTGPRQTVPVALPRRLTGTEIEPNPEQLSHPTRETEGAPRRRRRRRGGAAPPPHQPNAIAERRATLVIPYAATARPYRPRRPRHSSPTDSAAARLLPQEGARGPRPLPLDHPPRG